MAVPNVLVHVLIAVMHTSCGRRRRSRAAWRRSGPRSVAAARSSRETRRAKSATAKPLPWPGPHCVTGLSRTARSPRSAISDSAAVTISNAASLTVSANEEIGSLAGAGNVNLNALLIAGGSGTTTT
jgi:hypothetical protein